MGDEHRNKRKDRMNEAVIGFTSSGVGPSVDLFSPIRQAEQQAEQKSGE